jgi:hypothetical protein
LRSAGPTPQATFPPPSSAQTLTVPPARQAAGTTTPRATLAPPSTAQTPGAQVASPATSPAPSGTAQQGDEIDAFSSELIAAAFGPVPGLSAAALKASITAPLRAALALCVPVGTDAKSFFRSAFAVPQQSNDQTAGQAAADWIASILPASMLAPPPNASTAAATPAMQDPPDPPAQSIPTDTSHKQLWKAIANIASGVVFLTPNNILNTIQNVISEWASAIQADLAASLPHVEAALSNINNELQTTLPARAARALEFTTTGFIAQSLGLVNPSASDGQNVHFQIQNRYRGGVRWNTVVADRRVYRSTPSSGDNYDAAGVPYEQLSPAAKADMEKTPPNYTLNALAFAHSLYLPGMKRLSQFRDDLVDLTRAMTWEIKPIAGLVEAVFEEFYYRQSFNLTSAVWTDTNLSVAPLSIYAGASWPEGAGRVEPIPTSAGLAFPISFDNLPGVISYFIVSYQTLAAAVAAIAASLKKALDELAQKARNVAQRLQQVDLLNWVFAAVIAAIFVLFCFGRTPSLGRTPTPSPIFPIITPPSQQGATLQTSLVGRTLMYEFVSGNGGTSSPPSNDTQTPAVLSMEIGPLRLVNVPAQPFLADQQNASPFAQVLSQSFGGNLFS